MLVVIRNPVALLLGALLASASVVFALAGMGNEDRRLGGDSKVLRIRASSAPLLASDLAGFWDRRRDADVLSGWLAQYPADDRPGMRDWLSYHDARVSAGRARLRVETSSGPGTDGWFRLEVDRRASRVEPRCGGWPAPGCVRGRWRLDDFGLRPSDLLQ
jgi:hypothetical protein